jgi:hypothetical protein
MSQAMDLSSEQFMTLLTDALRAGPGSPEWHQAVGILKQAGANGADEYQLLIQARQDLESGKDYRAVRAGPGFGRKVLTAIEDEGSAKKGVPSANIVALLAAGAILAVVIVVAVVLFNSAPGPGDKKVDELRSLIFTQTVASATFSTGNEINPEWKLTGDVPLQIKDSGLRPGTTQPSANKPYNVGAMVKAVSIPPDQPFLAEAVIGIRVGGDGVIPEVFVSEGAVDSEKATGARELVWLMRNGQAQVGLPGGGVYQDKSALPKGSQTITVKIMMNKETVIVQSGENKLYEGAHGLAGDKPRYVGVRFRRKAGDTSNNTAWLSEVKVLKP